MKQLHCCHWYVSSTSTTLDCKLLCIQSRGMKIEPDKSRLLLAIKIIQFVLIIYLNELIRVPK